jgi:hypothetical protein
MPQVRKEPVWIPVDHLPPGIGRMRVLGPVRPYRFNDLGDIDVACTHCGALVFTGWNEGGLERVAAVECWRCKRASMVKKALRAD